MSEAQLAHPMDHIPVRQLRFDFDELTDQSLLWSQSNPDFSMFMNALGIHIPYFERFLVSVMRSVRGQLNDPKLLADVQALIGQEAHHAFNFVAWSARLAQRYPRVARLDAQAKSGFERALNKRSTFFQVGFVAGYETFTFLGGIIILDRYQELMAKADPVLRAFWVWHQVEEVEHGAVAFDVYQALYGEREWARKAMVVYAYGHIAKETAKAYWHMCRCEGFLQRPRRALKAAWFFARFAYDLAASALPVLRRGYHPRMHPICNDAQNPYAIAWRQRYETGLDLASLDDTALARFVEQGAS